MSTYPQLQRLLEVANSISAGVVPPYEHNECFTTGAYDLLLVNAQPWETFEMLKELCSRFEEMESSGVKLDGYYFLLSQLVQKSQTTELPNEMPRIIQAHKELSLDLVAWYRIHG